MEVLNSLLNISETSWASFNMYEGTGLPSDADMKRTNRKS